MHIITVDDQDFPDLLELFQHSSPIGNFVKDGKVQFVRTNQRLVMVSCGNTPDRIAVQPVRNTSEAESIAKQLLEVEEALGRIVTYSEI
ncbi:MAG: hypothetical protein KDD60_11660 [Bdellovibrionales bacterium]|nr:hypothetical protein [Bdellovibrionales bacterium]